MRGAASGFRASGEDHYRRDVGDHHGGHRDGEHAGGNRRVRGEETKAAFKLSSGVPRCGGPVGGHSCDAVRNSDRSHRGQVALWRGVLQHLHRHGCNVLHCLHHDPVCDQRRQVSSQSSQPDRSSVGTGGCPKLRMRLKRREKKIFHNLHQAQGHFKCRTTLTCKIYRTKSTEMFPMVGSIKSILS